MNRFSVGCAAALCLAACSPAVAPSAGDAVSSKEAAAIREAQEAMQKTVPAGSMLSKSTKEWQTYHNGQTGQVTPCDAEADMGSTEVLWVGDTQAVLKLLCQRGASQSVYVFYNLMNVGAEETVSSMWFDIFDDEGKRTRTNMLTDPLLDRSTKTITTLNKQRGAADCGTAATYEWRSDMGGFFDLLEFRQKLDCDGKAGEFPIIYTRGEPGAPEGQMVP